MVERMKLKYDAALLTNYSDSNNSDCNRSKGMILQITKIAPQTQINDLTISHSKESSITINNIYEPIFVSSNVTHLEFENKLYKGKVESLSSGSVPMRRKDNNKKKMYRN